MSEEEQKSLPGVAVRDEDNYRKLSEPFPSFDAANEALEAFFKDLREVRNKHKMTDVYVIISGSARTASGEEGEFVTSQHHGSSLKSESMVAWALGTEQTRRQEAIAKMIKGGIKKRLPRK